MESTKLDREDLPALRVRERVIGQQVKDAIKLIRGCDEDDVPDEAWLTLEASCANLVENRTLICEASGKAYDGPAGELVGRSHGTLLAAEKLLKDAGKVMATTRRSQPANGGIGHSFNDHTKGRIVGIENPRPNSYAAVFAGKEMKTGGFESTGQFVHHFVAALKGLGQSSLLASHSEGSMSDGGFLVPHGFIAADLDPSPEEEIILPRADVYPMNSESLSIAGVANQDESNGVLYGGFKAAWYEEGEEFDLQSIKTRKMTLRLKKLGLLSKASNELLEDSAFQSKLVPAMRKAIADARDEAFINGDGVGKPRGILKDPALIVVPKEGSQAADTITWANVVALWKRIHPDLISGAVWISNPTTLEQLLTLQIPLGTGAESRPAVMNANGQLTLMGRPVLMTSKAPVLGDQGDLILANLSQYAVGLGPDISLASSSHVGLTTDETYFRARMRADGQGKWEKPFTPRKGDTFSWVSTIAARA